MSHELFEIDARNPKMLTHIWNLCSIWLKTFLRDDRGSFYSGSSNYKWIGQQVDPSRLISEQSELGNALPERYARRTRFHHLWGWQRSLCGPWPIPKPGRDRQTAPVR